MAQVETPTKATLFGLARELFEIAVEVRLEAVSIVERLDGVRPTEASDPSAPKTEEKNMELLLEHIREILQNAQAKLNEADRSLGR